MRINKLQDLIIPPKTMLRTIYCLQVQSTLNQTSLSDWGGGAGSQSPAFPCPHPNSTRQSFHSPFLSQLLYSLSPDCVACFSEMACTSFLFCLALVLHATTLSNCGHILGAEARLGHPHTSCLSNVAPANPAFGHISVQQSAQGHSFSINRIKLFRPSYK